LAAGAEAAAAPVGSVPQDLNGSVVEGVALPTGGSPPPDIAGAVVGDDGSPPLPLGSVTSLPETVQLDFLFELCWGPCFRDAHFVDPGGSGLGSGPFPSDTPFHVRHGFVNNGEAPLGPGFDVVIYATALDEPGEFGGESIDQTYRYAADYVVRGTSEQCGPNYGAQTGPVTCEWFVHEFEDGLPEGRHALWAVWEAPCSAWAGLGFTETCGDPDAVMSFFSSGFDSPYGQFEPEYLQANEAFLSDDELAAREFEDPGFEGPELVADPSGAAPTGGTPVPDFESAIAGDDGSGPLPLGEAVTLPTSTRIDFLFEFCWYGAPCFRDGHFMAGDDPRLGSGPFTANTPFHVSHGFVNEGSAPLGEGFSVVIYVTPMDQPGESGGRQIGQTYRYTPDYVTRTTSDACGPTYRSQTGPVTCETFVHEFDDGLPQGRHAIWAVWEAPCSAWVDYGFAESCADPDEVLGLFTSGFDSPYGDFADFSEASEAP
jgi:hypothetical protein